MTDRDQINQYFTNISLFCWENRVSQQDITDWVNNFKPAKRIDSKKMAIDLLFGFIFYNEKEVQYLCKHAFNELKRQKIKEFIKEGFSIRQSEERYRVFISDTKFIGKTGDSSGHVAYSFRQINDIPISNYISSIEEIDSNLKSLIMVDDFLGTGDTVKEFHQNLIEKEILSENPKLQVYYLVLIAMEEGISRINRECPECHIIYSELLNNSYKVFSDDTTVLSNYSIHDKAIARDVCEKLGEFLEGSEYALGYHNSEILIGFHHNIPNNTLPIIWSDSQDWYPIFPRRRKRY